MPGIPKKPSVIKAPSTRVPKESPMIVNRGIRAFLRMCFFRISNSFNPFERAVRT